MVASWNSGNPVGHRDYKNVFCLLSSMLLIPSFGTCFTFFVCYVCMQRNTGEILWPRFKMYSIDLLPIVFSNVFFYLVKPNFFPLNLFDFAQWKDWYFYIHSFHQNTLTLCTFLRMYVCVHNMYIMYISELLKLEEISRWLSDMESDARLVWELVWVESSWIHTRHHSLVSGIQGSHPGWTSLDECHRMCEFTEIPPSCPPCLSELGCLD